jgi:AbrB family looped-hinge helix DNA binding protein
MCFAELFKKLRGGSMPVRPVKIGETRVDKRGRMVLPADLRKVLGVSPGENFNIYRLEGALDIFGETLHIAAPMSREAGLLLISYAPVTKDNVVSVMESWATHYSEIKSILGHSTQKEGDH